jgi:hypothetical protein
LARCPQAATASAAEQVAHNQRERLIAGLATAVRREGLHRGDDHRRHQACAGLTPRLLRQLREQGAVLPRRLRGGWSGHIHELAAEAGEGIEDWPGQAIAASRAVLSFLAASPTSRASAWSSRRAPGRSFSARFHEAVHEVVPFLEQGRAERQAERELPPTTEESTIGALVLLASRKVVVGRSRTTGRAPPRLRGVHSSRRTSGRGSIAPGTSRNGE